MSKKCFIVCPIGDEGTEIRNRSDTVFDYFLKPVCEGMGYEIIRCDKISGTGKIDSDIINYLETAELVIADLTDLNPNVFYEIGYRKAKGTPCIHIAQEGTELPFDVKTFRTYFYSTSDIPKYEKFKESLKCAIDSLESRINDSEKATHNVDEDNTSIEQKLLDRLFILEDSLQSFYGMIEDGFVDIDKRIEECCRSHSSPQESIEQTLMEIFMKEAMRNPVNAKRFISQFQNLDIKNNPLT